MGGLVKKIPPEEYAPMQWYMQAVIITTNIKVKVNFTLHALSATNSVTWNCHVDDSAKGRYNIILRRYLLTELVLNLKFSEHVIEADDGTFEGSTTPMVDFVTYIFKYLNTEGITGKEYFNNAYVEGLYQSEHVFTDIKLLRVILDEKYEKADLHKFMKN